MARPKADLPDAEAIRALIDLQGRLAVRVTPGARDNALALGSGGLTARVRAKPQDGEANAAVRELLASALGIAQSRVRLLRGSTSREKVFAIDT